MWELLVSATEEELNQAPRERRVPDRILSIMLEPGTKIAGGSGPRYRVIYRAKLILEPKTRVRFWPLADILIAMPDEADIGRIGGHCAHGNNGRTDMQNFLL